MAEQAKAPAETLNRVSRAGGKVTVACRIPNGFVMHIDDLTDSVEIMSGGRHRNIQVARRRAETVKLNGPASPYGVAPRYRVLLDKGGQPSFALTHNVDQDFWEAWLEQNKEADYIKNGLIFAFEKEDTVVSRAKELRDERSGLEPIVPDTDPRTSRRVTEEESRKKKRALEAQDA